MAYYESDNVHVFPSAYRKKFAAGKYTSEYNFTNIINSIVDVDSYVLSTDETLANDHTLRVVIHGYYFEIKEFSKPSGKLYLAIKVEKNNHNALVQYGNGSNYDETALDDNTYFKGLYYGNEYPNDSGEEYYTIYRLQVCNDSGELINKVRLSTDSVFFGDVEDNEDLTGELNKKQNSLVVTKESGLELSADSNLKINDKYNRTLESAYLNSSGVGSSIQPIYINANGEFNALSGSSGTAQVNSSGSTRYSYTQSALITNGSLSDKGVTFYASQDDPPVSTNIGRNGDFWFKYTA